MHQQQQQHIRRVAVAVLLLAVGAASSSRGESTQTWTHTAVEGIATYTGLRTETDTAQHVATASHTMLPGNVSGCANASVCSGHGQCEAIPDGGFECACEAGFTGASCNISSSNASTCIAPNSSSGVACSGHGYCNYTSTGFACECESGWVGLDCNTATTPSNGTSNASACFAARSDLPCSGNGECVAVFNDTQYFCECAPSWTGPQCQVAQQGQCIAPNSSGVACSGHGNCAYTNGFACACESGWIGTYCETDSSNCTGADGSECSGNGQCVYTPDGSEICECNAGWVGPTCGNSTSNSTSSNNGTNNSNGSASNSTVNNSNGTTNSSLVSVSPSWSGNASGHVIATGHAAASSSNTGVDALGRKPEFVLPAAAVVACALVVVGVMVLRRSRPRGGTVVVVEGTAKVDEGPFAAAEEELMMGCIAVPMDAAACQC